MHRQTDFTYADSLSFERLELVEVDTRNSHLSIGEADRSGGRL